MVYSTRTLLAKLLQLNGKKKSFFIISVVLKWKFGLGFVICQAKNRLYCSSNPVRQVWLNNMSVIIDHNVSTDFKHPCKSMLRSNNVWLADDFN